MMKYKFYSEIIQKDLQDNTESLESKFTEYANGWNRIDDLFKITMNLYNHI